MRDRFGNSWYICGKDPNEKLARRDRQEDHKREDKMKFGFEIDACQLVARELGLPVGIVVLESSQG
jgi:hypothetical protein